MFSMLARAKSNFFNNFPNSFSTACFNWTKIDPQVNRGAEILVAGIAKFNLVNLTRLKADGGGAGVTLKGLVILKSVAIIAALT